MLRTLVFCAFSWRHRSPSRDLPVRVLSHLSCPQDRARDGHYGSYLLSRRDWPCVVDMVRTLHEQLAVPVFCKIRLLQTFDETLELCLLLQAAGCACIAVHGRKRGSNRRRRVGPADLEQVGRLKRALHIPVIANGNIRSFAEARANLVATGCDGVMSAEAVLADPTLFAGNETQQQQADPLRCIELAREYLRWCGLVPPPPLHWIADHVHNICRAAIEANHWPDLRAALKAVGRDQPISDAGASVAPVTDGTAQQTQETGVAAILAVLDELRTRLQTVQATGSDDARAKLQRLRAERRAAAAKASELDASALIGAVAPQPPAVLD